MATHKQLVMMEHPGAREVFFEAALPDLRSPL